jgi:hypothetical protein
LFDFDTKIDSRLAFHVLVVLSFDSFRRIHVSSLCLSVWWPRSAPVSFAAAVRSAQGFSPVIGPLPPPLSSVPDFLVRARSRSPVQLVARLSAWFRSRPVFPARQAWSPREILFSREAEPARDSCLDLVFSVGPSVLPLP